METEIGKNIHSYNELTSTNDKARQLFLSDNLKHGDIVLTDFQEKGRGQSGSQWYSSPGLNILASIILIPEFLEPEKQFYISMVASMAIYDILKEEGGEAHIKWPNDIYLGHKKVAGILIENLLQGNKITCSILGIGVNVNENNFPKDLPNPISMKQAFYKDFDKMELLKRISVHLDRYYKIMVEGRYHVLREKYLNRLLRHNQRAAYQVNGKRFMGKIKDVSDAGLLLVENDLGDIVSFDFKEIEFIELH